MEKRFETILSLELPYREILKLQRSIYRGGSGPRVAITAGIHGDELEGLYVCHRLAAWLEALERTRPEALLGQVELYPGMNPLGLDTLQRTVPVYDSDLNRSFPGHPHGLLPQRIAAAALAHLEGAALVIDVHASNIYLREIPQTRIDERFATTLLPLARRLNLDIIWIQQNVMSLLETTLVHSLNQHGTPCLSVEMGAGISLTTAFAEQLLSGILTLCQELGVLAPDLVLPEPSHRPLIVDDSKIHPLNAVTSGMFVPALEHGVAVTINQLLGHIVSPFQGDSLAVVRSPVAGRLFTLRRYPLVYEGSLLARIVETPTLEQGS